MLSARPTPQSAYVKNMMALFGGRGGQKKTGHQRRKGKKQKKARDAQTAEAKEAKAPSRRSRPEEDEVVIVKASRAPDNSSAEMVKVRAGLKVAHQHGRCFGATKPLRLRRTGRGTRSSGDVLEKRG